MPSKIGGYIDRLSTGFSSSKDDYKDLKGLQKFGTVVLSIFAGLATLPFLCVGGFETFNSLVGRFKKANENKKKTTTEKSAKVGSNTLKGAVGSKDETPPAATPAEIRQFNKVKKLEEYIEIAKGQFELVDSVLNSEKSSVQDRIDALETIASTSKKFPKFTDTQLKTAEEVVKGIKNPKLKARAQSIVEFINDYNSNPYLQKHGEDIAGIFCALHDEMKKSVVPVVDFSLGDAKSLSVSSTGSVPLFLAEDDKLQIKTEGQLAASLPEETAKGFETFSSKNLNDYQGLFTFILALKAMPDIDNVKLRLAKSNIREDQKVEILEKFNKLVDDVESIKEEIKTLFLLDLVGKDKKAKSGKVKFIAFSKLVQDQNNLKKKIKSLEVSKTSLASKLADDKVGELIKIAEDLEKQKTLFDRILTYDIEILRTYVQMSDELMKPSEGGKSDFALLTNNELDQYEDILKFVQSIVVLKSEKPEIDVSTKVKGLIDDDTSSEVSMDKVKLSLREDLDSLKGVLQVNKEEQRKVEAQRAKKERYAAIMEKQKGEALLLRTALTVLRDPSLVRKTGGQGIVNPGNYCYMIATLQVILNSSIGEKINSLESKGIQPPNPFNVDKKNTLSSEVLKLISELKEEMSDQIGGESFIEKFKKLEGEIFNEDSTLKILNKDVLESYRDLSDHITDKKLVDDLASINEKNAKVKELFRQLKFHDEAKEKVKINLAALKLFQNVYDGQSVFDSKNKKITLERAANYLMLVTKNPETSLFPGLSGQLLDKQEDAQEYMQGVLETLGYTFNVRTVNAAGDDKSSRKDPSSMITLQVIDNVKTLKELIEAYRKETIEDSENEWKYEAPGGEIRYHPKYAKTIAIVDEIPDQIVINLKRFEHTLRGSSKINYEVTVGDTLELGSFIDGSLKVKGVSTRYRLKAYVHHDGDVGGGHYTANVKIDGQWRHYNDEKVSKIKDERNIRNKSYIYVFERIKN